MAAVSSLWMDQYCSVGGPIMAAMAVITPTEKSREFISYVTSSEVSCACS